MSTIAAGPSQASSSPFAQQKSPLPTYEFTKRKRWADLLMTELVDNVTFVLSPIGKVLYCGPAVTEILGWKNIDLLDGNFIELVDAIDQSRFRSAFNESLLTSREFNCLVRLKSNDRSASYENTSNPQSVLFDVKCYPHVVNDGTAATKCLFAMAAPYPSRNTAMLDTILDLKVENNRLQKKVAEYRARLPANVLPSAQPSVQGPIYATTSLNPSRHVPQLSGSAPKTEPYLTSSQMDDMLSGSKSLDFGNLLFGSAPPQAEEPLEEGSKKKKLKRTHNIEQYVCVTCGRTDSPEWRKGPSGPKTLCNACGLRWAKQMRKTDEPAEGAAIPPALDP